jgi:hypothetical protein
MLGDGFVLLCEVTGSLPNPGGLLQQNAGHIWRLEQVFRARHQYESDQMSQKSGERKSDTEGPKGRH